MRFHLKSYMFAGANQKLNIMSTDDQTRFLNSAKAGAHVLADNTLVWDAVPKRLDKHNDLNNSTAAIDLLLGDQGTDHTGLAANKKVLKLNAGKTALLVAKPMAVYAKDTGNLTLLGEIDFELSDLIRGKDADLAAKWLLVFQRASVPATAAALVAYGVTALMITDVDLARTKFLNAASDPQSAAAHTQAVTDAIANEFKHLRSIVTDIRDMAKALPAANADLAKEIDEVFELNKSGVHHVVAQIEFRDKDTNVLLPHVKFTLNQGATTVKTMHSTKRGLVTIKDVGNGSYVGLSELKNYLPGAQINMGISDGQIFKTTVLLSVDPISGHPVIN